MEQDPTEAGYLAGMNLYVAMDSNPVRATDPSGHAAEDAVGTVFPLRDPDSGDPAGSVRVTVTGSNLCDPKQKGKIHLHMAFHSTQGDVSKPPSRDGYLVINGGRVDVTPVPGVGTDVNGDFDTDAGGPADGGKSGEIIVVAVLTSKAQGGNTGGFMSFKIDWSYTCKCGVPGPMNTTITTKEDRDANIPTTKPTTAPAK